MKPRSTRPQAGRCNRRVFIKATVVCRGRDYFQVSQVVGQRCGRCRSETMQTLAASCGDHDAWPAWCGEAYVKDEGRGGISHRKGIGGGWIGSRLCRVFASKLDRGLKSCRMSWMTCVHDREAKLTKILFGRKFGGPARETLTCGRQRGWLIHRTASDSWRLNPTDD
jgi:hypothetical protein